MLKTASTKIKTLRQVEKICFDLDLEKILN